MLGCTEELGKKWGKVVAARREECWRRVTILGMHAVNGNLPVFEQPQPGNHILD